MWHHCSNKLGKQDGKKKTLEFFHGLRWEHPTDSAFVHRASLWVFTD